MIIQLLILCGIKVLSQQICQCSEYKNIDCVFPCENSTKSVACQARTNCGKYVNKSDCWFPHCYWNSDKCQKFQSCIETNVSEYQNNSTDVRKQMCQALKCGIDDQTSFCKNPTNCSTVEPFYECTNTNTNQSKVVKKKNLNKTQSANVTCVEINTCENEIMINKASIIGFDRCLMVDNVCQAYSGCSSLKTKDGCAMDASCIWDRTFNCTQKKCKDRSSCEAGCQQVGQLCQSLDCNRYQSHDACMGDASFSCAWNGTHCFNCRATKIPNFFNTSAISLTAIGAVFLLGMNI